jgi:hypothetical protein
MTPPPGDKTDFSDKTPAMGRMARRAAAYEKALAMAREAIQAARATPQIGPADRVLRALERDQPVDAETILAVLRAATSGAARGRGRPKGSGAAAERRACRAAILATDLLRGSLEPYRNPASQHRLTLSDAIAEAMRLEGFRRLATYEAVAAEVRRLRRQYRAAIRTVLPGIRQQIAFIRNAQPALAKVGPPILKALEKWKKSKAMLDDK